MILSRIALTIQLVLMSVLLLQGQMFQKKKYAEFLEPGSKLKDYGYHYTLEKMPNGEFIYKIFYPQTKQMTHYITYSNGKLNKLNGAYAEWLDNGQLIRKGDFSNGLKEGKWVESKSLNKLDYEKGMYINNKREGRWETTDSTGKLLQVHHYDNGELNGLGINYEEGKIVEEVVYEKGELKMMLKQEERQSESEEEKKIVLPAFPGCEDIKDRDSEEFKECSREKMLNFIYNKIRYPSSARNNNVKGMAILSFTIDKEGDVSNIRVLRGVCASIEKECVRVVESMPRWNPGYLNAKPIDIYFNLPVQFRL